MIFAARRVAADWPQPCADDDAAHHVVSCIVLFCIVRSFSEFRAVRLSFARFSRTSRLTRTIWPLAAHLLGQCLVQRSVASSQNHAPLSRRRYCASRWNSAKAIAAAFPTFDLMDAENDFVEKIRLIGSLFL